MKTLITTLLFSVLSVTALAEQKVEFNGYEMHYIVLNTTEVPADIAKRYQFNRSGKRAFINLSILKQTDDGYGSAVPATVNAVERTLLGQKLDISLREIREGDAIYYIGDFPIFDREVLWFDVNLTLQDGTQFSYTFDQQVWQE
ncbi:MAG: DUF4426 domain-containing protein [Reinekea sp.]|jgi:hypothetical protein